MTYEQNMISATMDDAVHASIITDVKGIESKMPWAITLPIEERRSMATVGLKNIDFISKCLEYAEKNPELPPQYLDMVEFGKDVRLLKQLQNLMQHFVPLMDKLKDSYAVLGAEAYNSARLFYHHVKNAVKANIPGASSIARELAKRYKVSSSTSPDNSEPVASSSKDESAGTPEIKSEEVAEKRKK